MPGNTTPALHTVRVRQALAGLADGSGWERHASLSRPAGEEAEVGRELGQYLTCPPTPTPAAALGTLLPPGAGSASASDQFPQDGSFFTRAPLAYSRVAVGGPMGRCLSCNGCSPCVSLTCSPCQGLVF